jgi:hypothetical protein
MKSSDVAALYDRVPPGALVQITPEHLPKVVKAPRSQPTNTFVAASPKPQSQDQTISTPASGTTLSVEQMRTGGAIAAQRQKAKLELNNRDPLASVHVHRFFDLQWPTPDQQPNALARQ